MSTTLNDATDQPRLLTESECKDLTRQMNFTMRRVEEIRPYLTANSQLTQYINQTCDEYREKIRGRLKPYQDVMIQHTIFALKKLDRGDFPHNPLPRHCYLFISWCSLCQCVQRRQIHANGSHNARPPQSR